FATAAQDDPQHRSALDRLRELTTDAGDPKWRATYLLEEARAAYGHTELGALQDAANAALTAARECADAASAARALSYLADVETNRGNFDAAQSLLEQVQSEAVKAQDGAVELDSLRASFMVAYNRADVERTTSIAQQWLERGMALGDRYGEASGRLRMAIALVTRRHDVARIREELARAHAIFEELHWQRGIAGVLLNQGILENEIANFDEAARLTERSLEIFIALDDARGRSTALTNLATVHAELGDGERAHREAEASIRVAQEGGLRPAEALGFENLALATAASGKLADAIRLGEQALSKHEELGSKSRSVRLIGDLALWYAQTGDLRSARQRVDEMLPLGAHIWAEWPQRFHWIAAQVLRATGERVRSRDELRLAHELVTNLAAELQGEDLQRYLSAACNAEIVRAADSDEWPTLSAGQT
ncbi:MAG TPA: tetratricopeptide repeat protein, partial [Caldimonas sp.]|nr:tetratricopeptide repeat protein [Caldimonas sp.]